MLNIELISALAVSGCFGLPFVILGVAILLYPHKAINSSLAMAKRLPNFDPDDVPSNPYRRRYIFYYQLTGLSFIAIGILPAGVLLITN